MRGPDQGPSCLYQAAARKRGTGPVTYDQVVQQPDIEELERRLYAPGDALIGLAGLGDPGRVIVGEDYGRRIDLQGLLDDFPGVDTGAVDSAAEQLLERQDTMAVIQVQAAEQLVRQVPEPGHQKSFGVRRAANGVTYRQALLVIAPGKLRDGLEYAKSYVAKAGFGSKEAVLGVQQPP